MENTIVDYGPLPSRNFKKAQTILPITPPGGTQTGTGGAQAGVGGSQTGVGTHASGAAAPASGAISTSGYTPQDIVDIYNVLAPMSTDYANANLERAGQAQASYGPLAQAAMGDSRTAGIGNYTYNRLVRPSVDTMRDQLIVSGLSAALNKQISDSINAARENYNRAARRHSRGGGGGGGDDGKNPSGSGNTKINGYEDEQTSGNAYGGAKELKDSYKFWDKNGNEQKVGRPDGLTKEQWLMWWRQIRKDLKSRGYTVEDDGGL